MQPLARSSIARDYDTIVEKVVEYGKLSQGIAGRVGRRLALRPWLIMRNFGVARSSIASRALLSSRQTPLNKQLMEEWASHEQRTHSLFQAVIAEYPIDALIAKLRLDYPDIDFARLAQLHKARMVRLRPFGPREIFGVLFGAGTLVLKTVPEPVVRRMGWGIDTFQEIVFWVMLGLIAYILIVVTPIWIVEVKAKSNRELVGRVLEYAALVEESNESKGNC